MVEIPHLQLAPEDSAKRSRYHSTVTTERTRILLIESKKPMDQAFLLGVQALFENCLPFTEKQFAPLRRNRVSVAIR